MIAQVVETVRDHPEKIVIRQAVKGAFETCTNCKLHEICQVEDRAKHMFLDSFDWILYNITHVCDYWQDLK